MLKEAIADAKTIKETAIASAKSALEEAFTPQLTAMFAEKLNELEMDEEMEEESMNEMHGEEEEVDENFNLEELLAELSMEEEGQEPKMEGKDMEDKSLEEDLMLEEMSDEEIEELVMQVIDDMITSGKLMPGEGEEEGEEDMEDMEDMGGEEDIEDEEEVNIDEILAEMESEVKEGDCPSGVYYGNQCLDETKIRESDDCPSGVYYGMQCLDEAKLSKPLKITKGAKLKTPLKITKGLEEETVNEADASPMELFKLLMDPAKWEVASNVASQFLATPAGAATVGTILTSAAALPFIGPKIKEKFKDLIAKAEAAKKQKPTKEAKEMETEATNAEMEETINELRKELNEVNLLNAKLLYTNKIFKAKNLTESEKIKVLNTFDKAETVKEVRLVFETLTESFKTTTVKKNIIKESLGSASKTISTATPKQPIIEVNNAFARMQQLAGLKK